MTWKSHDCHPPSLSPRSRKTASLRVELKQKELALQQAKTKTEEQLKRQTEQLTQAVLRHGSAESKMAELQSRIVVVSGGGGGARRGDCSYSELCWYSITNTRLLHTFTLMNAPTRGCGGGGHLGHVQYMHLKCELPIQCQYWCQCWRVRCPNWTNSWSECVYDPQLS